SYEFGRLDYEGWSFFTVVADLPDVKSRKTCEEIIGENLPESKKDTIEFLKESIAQQSDKLKIAIISTPFFTVPPKGYSGLEMVVFDIAQGLVNNGHDVTIFAPEGSNIEGGKVFAFGESVNAVNVNWLELEKDRMVKSIDYILNNGFQIAHGNTWFGFEYMLKSKSPNIKVTHTHHGGLNLQFWGTSKPPFKLNFIAISKWMQQVYASQGFNSIYIYNGIDIDKYKYQESKGNRLIFVGRASSFKQPHVAIEIAKKLGLGLDLVCGTFVDSQQYLEQVKSMCDGKQIVWHGDASHEEKIALLQNAKCLLFPSKMGEPYGLVAAESMCTGTPCVALRDGAIPEVVEHGVTGYICDTAEDMVEAVKKVDIISPRDCRERVERLFDRRVIARQYADAYRKILSGEEW
ncbi:MAG: glycosyltransferase family 4 protein, partial [Ignavibacteria bacterium]|nr:glycosyltransferase family 4 protein [Ignavibacteria bacterium]